MIHSVTNNKANYTNRAYSRAVLARSVQKVVGCSTTKELLKIVELNLLKKYLMSREYILIAENIFGPDVGSLNGETVRRGTEHVEVAVVPEPAELMSQYRNVIVGADIREIRVESCFH